MDCNGTATGALILCPFHDDHDNSCSVHRNKGYFHCFGCGESGPFYRLIAEIDGITVERAKKEWYEEEKIEAVLEDIESQLLLEDVSHKAVMFSQSSFNERYPYLLESQEGWDYARNTRHLTPLIIERFNLRWGGLRGSFRNRIIIPIHDTKDRLISWTGRTIIPDMQPKTKKKRTAASVLFGLVNLYDVYHAARDRINPLIVVEGEFDAMYLQQFGYAAVASMGTSGLTGKQLALVVKHAERVVLCYDSDPGGRKGTYGYTKKNGERKRGDLEKLRELVPVECLTLPKGKDPNDLAYSDIKRYFGKYKEKI